MSDPTSMTTSEPHRTLSEDLAELERTDPKVRAAAESFERTKQKIIEGRSHPIPCLDESCRWHHDTHEPREALLDVLCRIEFEVKTSGPAAGLVYADSMADAILQGLAEGGYEIRHKEKQ